MVKDIRIENYSYHLPDERIPRHPLSERDACRLLVCEEDGIVKHLRFSDLPDLLPEGTVAFCNDTRVINARMTFFKTTGSRIEIFLLDPIAPADYVLTFQTRGKCVWRCMVGNLKRWKEGSLELIIYPADTSGPVVLRARRLESLEGNSHAVEFTWDNPEVTFASVVEAAGKIPIPPYLKRDTEESDIEDYQTVYADAKGSVAAPTAGLHFTPEVIGRMERRGIPLHRLTLHVGAGTFQPVKSDRIGDHPMHTEIFTVNRETLRALIRAKRDRLPVAAVGTTSVRTLESLPLLGRAILNGDTSLHVSQWTAYDHDGSADTVEYLISLHDYMESKGLTRLTASTAIMIAPGFRWQVVDIMVTNFHQPESTLLLLVASFLGDRPEISRQLWRGLYEEALRKDYRFLSYGDACLFFRHRPERVTLPKSKSIGARFLTASYFAGTLGHCQPMHDCDDLEVIHKALLELEYNREWLNKGWPPIDVHASGTAFRFVTAAVASTPAADYLVTGTPRLCSRPMEPLLEVLRHAGASIDPQGSDGKGPYHILGRRLKGGDFEIRGDVSSQFISALMLVAPTWKGGMNLRFTTPLVSRPYVEMTAEVMSRFGVGVRLDSDGVSVSQSDYLAPRNFYVEADWSAAGFFYEAVSISGHPLRITGLQSPDESLQGDSATAEIFRSLGVESRFADGEAVVHKEERAPEKIEADLSHTPDLVPALTVACVFNETRFRFSGVRNLRIKESDRLQALENEMYKLGYVVSSDEDTLEWDGRLCDADSDPVITTYDDHRIAMAFAMAALCRGSIRIENPDVVEKSFADFWNQLPHVGLECRREDNIMIVERRDEK